MDIARIFGKIIHIICLLRRVQFRLLLAIIKEIDALGRIVIPKEFRERLGLKKEVEVVLTVDGVLIRNSEYEIIKKVKNKA